MLIQLLWYLLFNTLFDVKISLSTYFFFYAFTYVGADKAVFKTHAPVT